MSCATPAWIRLGGKRGGCAVVDEADATLVCSRRWYHAKVGYVASDAPLPRYYMHRLLLGSPNGQPIDHINGNRLDNRRANLRVTTPAGNLQNQRTRRMREGEYKGVHFEKARQCWRAHIQVNKKQYFLGRYDSPEQAAFAYDKAAREHFGEMACCNFEPIT